MANSSSIIVIIEYFRKCRYDSTFFKIQIKPIMPSSLVSRFSSRLENELLLLRLLELHDYEQLYRVASDPLIWEQHPERERYKPEIFKRFFDGALESPAAYSITDKTTNQFIGSSRYYYLTSQEIKRYQTISPSVHNAICIGYTFLARSHWGGKFNGSLKRLMIDHAFTTFESVIFQIGEHNIRSRTAVERLGALRLPLQDDLPDHVGVHQAHVIYELTKGHRL